MSDEILKLIETVVYLLVAVAGAILTPMVHKWLAARAGEANANRIFDWADTFVKMAEKKMAADGGSAKYQYVYDAIRAYADRNSIKIDPKNIEAAIEASVYQLKQGMVVPGNLLVAEPVTVTAASTVPAPVPQG